MLPNVADADENRPYATSGVHLVAACKHDAADGGEHEGYKLISDVRGMLASLVALAATDAMDATSHGSALFAQFSLLLLSTIVADFALAGTR